MQYEKEGLVMVPLQVVTDQNDFRLAFIFYTLLLHDMMGSIEG